MRGPGIRNVTPDEERRIVAVYLGGATYSEISERFHRSYETIGRILRRAEAKRKAGQPTPAAPLTAAQRLRLENTRRQQRFYEHNYLGCFR